MACAVTGCSSEASELHLQPNASYSVCGEHRDKLDEGEDWMPDNGQGILSDIAPAAIRMGQSHTWRVLAVSSTRSGGGRPGILLRLTLVKDGANRDLELLVPFEERDILLSLLGAQADDR